MGSPTLRARWEAMGRAKAWADLWHRAAWVFMVRAVRAGTGDDKRRWTALQRRASDKSMSAMERWKAAEESRG